MGSLRALRFVISILLGLGWAGEASAKLSNALIKRGDFYYQKRADLTQVRKALAFYKKAIAVEPSDSRGYWKAAAVLFWLGRHAKDKEEALDFFKQEIEFGKLCVQVAPKDPNCHYWLAVGYGKYGETKGVLQSLYLLPYVVEEFQKVIELSPEYRKGEPYAALGYVYFVLPSWLPGKVKGDKEKAGRLFLKALGIGPDHLVNHLLYAKMLIKAGRRKEALHHLKFVLSAPIEKDFEPECVEFKKEARDILEKIRRK